MDLYGAGKNTEETGKKKRFKNPLNKIRLPKKHLGMLGLILAIIIIGGVAFVYRNQSTESSPNNILDELNVEEQEKENKDIIEKVNELTLIPVGEEPEIATVDDKSKLGDQAFFSRAENGDKVIIYRNAKRVVLYRPSTNQIVETGPLVEPTAVPEPIFDDPQVLAP